jgi:HK97 gp10 family phage protein
MYFKISANIKPLMDKLTKVQEQHKANMTSASVRAAIYVQAQAKLNISGGARTGRLYKRRSIVHRASAPGEYPKTDTGRLVSSISVEKGEGFALVGSNLEYAPLLEYGTPKMDARPWLKRTYNDSIGKIAMIYRDALRASWRL